MDVELLGGHSVDDDGRGGGRCWGCGASGGSIILDMAGDALALKAPCGDTEGFGGL